MAYQAFYNKYRPQTFEEVVGQKAVVSTLKNAIKDNKIAHAYLFCGPRGTGKTTMARLFAKALNCKEGLGHQCNACDSCIGIMKGEHPDVIEIDAASNSTVDSVRQLIDNISYQPIMSDYKVYIIDEVHNMSNLAFNALLKTLEEPPEFAVFILATTEPQKILPTILSRVQRFDFSKVTEKDLITNMERVLKSENIEFESEALRLIANLSDGGVRDSLSLLDKLVSYAGNHLTVKDVDEMLGLLSLQDEISLINLISAKKTKEVLTLVKEKYESGMDITRLQNDLISIYKDFIIYVTTKEESLMDRLKESEARQLNLSLNEARNCVETLLQSKRDNRNVDDVVSHFQLTLINMMSEKIVTTESAPKSEKKNVDDPGDRKQNALASQAVEIRSRSNGFVSEHTEEKKEGNELIRYTTTDIVKLMYQGIKQDRVAIKSHWDDLEKYFNDDKYSYVAKPLHLSNLSVTTKDVLLVTLRSPIEIEKINKKATQPLLQELIKLCFGKTYRLLPVLEADVASAIAQYKSGGKPESLECTIDFGEENKTSGSTAFMDELLG